MALVDVYGGRAHPDRLQVSLDEILNALAGGSWSAVPVAAAAPGPTTDVGQTAPGGAVPPGPSHNKWHPAADGLYHCTFEACERTFAKPQGVGRHYASVHGGADSPAVPTAPPLPEAAGAAKTPADEMGPIASAVNDLIEGVDSGTVDPEIACLHCGCTQDRACLTEDGPCSWTAPGLCSACILPVRDDLAHGKDDGDPLTRDQRARIAVLKAARKVTGDPRRLLAIARWILTGDEAQP